MQLLTGVLNWLVYDWINRRQHATALLKKLHLGVVPLECLRKNLEFAQGNDMTECCEVLKQVLVLVGDSKPPSEFLDSCQRVWLTPRGAIQVRK